MLNNYTVPDAVTETVCSARLDTAGQVGLGHSMGPVFKRTQPLHLL